MHKENMQISVEKLYYHIPDQYISIIKQNNIPLIKDHGNYYCILTMRQLYQLFNNSSNIVIKYFCEKCNAMHTTNCQNITRKINNNNGHLYCPKCSKRMSLYKYSNTVPISKQQKYFFDLFNTDFTVLNHPEGKLFIDIAIPTLNIGIEYNGGGHDYSIKANVMSHSQFIQKEWHRRYALLSNNWKIIYIITPHDKIHLYTDDEYIRLFNYAYLLLQDETIVEIYLEDNRILTHTKMTYISDILAYKEKNMQIFSINQALEYLHISKKTLYRLHNNKILPMNITPYNFKYYPQDQLDEYLNNNKVLNSQYLLAKEAAKYLNVKPYKLDLLKTTKELFPQVINHEQYYSITQLDQCIQSGILNEYYSASEGLNYINQALQINLCNMPFNLKETYVINQHRYYLKKQLDEYISKRQYLNSLYTREQAAEYLHLSLATLDRLKQQNLLIPIENNYLYSREQLDEYLVQNNRAINFDDYVTVTEASNIYPLTKKQIWNLIYSNKITSKRINNLHYILKQDLESYLNKIHKFDNEYIPLIKVRELFSLDKAVMRSLRESNRVRAIKQDSIYLYNEEDIINYINRHDNYINITQCCSYLNITRNTLLKLENVGALVPDNGKYLFNDILDFKTNIEKNFVIIRKAFKVEGINQFLINKKFYIYKKELFDYLKANDIKVITLQKLCDNKIDEYIKLLNKHKIKWIDYLDCQYILLSDYLNLKQKLINVFISQTNKILNKRMVKEKENELMNVKESAKYLNISEAKIRYLIEVGKLQSTIVKRKYYMRIEWLNGYKNKYCNTDGLLSFIEAYQYLNISHNTLEQMIKRNELTVTFIDKKRYFKLDELNKIKDIKDVSGFLDINKAAEYLNLPTYTINTYAKQGKIKYLLKNNHYYFFKEDLDKYLQDSKMIGLYTLDQTMQYLNTSRSSLQRWKKANKLVPIYKFSKPYYLKEQLDKFKN